MAAADKKYPGTGGALQELITYIKERLDNKVDKVSGKGLSTNDFTDEYKAKIGALENKVAELERRNT